MGIEEPSGENLDFLRERKKQLEEGFTDEELENEETRKSLEEALKNIDEEIEKNS